MGTYYELKNMRNTMFRNIAKDSHHLFVENITDLLKADDPTEVESIFFSLKVTQLPIPFVNIPIDYSKFPNLEKLTFNFPIGWDYIATLQIPCLKELYFLKDETPITKRLQFSALTSLEISFFHCYKYENDKESVPIRQYFDLSGLPNVRSVTFRYAEWVDYTSLYGLKELRALGIFEKSIESLEWLKNLPPLRALTIHGGLEDIYEIVEYQPNLQSLNIRDNNISDIKSLLSMRNLSIVNAYGNPLKDEKEFREQFHGQVCLNEDDKIKSNLRIEIDRFVELALRQMDYEIEKYNELHPFIRKKVDRLLALGKNKMTESYLQGIFEIYFRLWTVPGHFNEQYFSPDYKEYYVDYAKEIYPYLRISESIREGLKKARICAKEKYRGDNNHLFVVGKDFYIIEATVDYGTGDIRITGDFNSSLKRSMIATVEKKWKYFIKESERTRNDYDIRILSLYGTDADADFVNPIMYLLCSILNGRKISEDTAMMQIMEKSEGYSLRSEILQMLRLADLQNINNIVISAPKDEDREEFSKYGGERFIYCNSTEAVLNAISCDVE